MEWVCAPGSSLEGRAPLPSLPGAPLVTLLSLLFPPQLLPRQRSHCLGSSGRGRCSDVVQVPRPLRAHLHRSLPLRAVSIDSFGPLVFFLSNQSVSVFLIVFFNTPLLSFEKLASHSIAQVQSLFCRDPNQSPHTGKKLR